MAYLTKLSVAPIIYCRLTGLTVNNELQGCGRNRVQPNSTFIPKFVCGTKENHLKSRLGQPRFESRTSYTRSSSVTILTATFDKKPKQIRQFCYTFRRILVLLVEPSLGSPQSLRRRKKFFALYRAQKVYHKIKIYISSHGITVFQNLFVLVAAYKNTSTYISDSEPV